MRNFFTGSSDRRYVYSYLIGVLLLVVLAELIIRYYTVPKDEFWRLAEKIHYGQSANVIIGDSQTEYAFITSPLVNLSKGGMTPLGMEVVVEEYFKKIRPDKVILAIAPQMFSKSRIEVADWGFRELLDVDYFNNKSRIFFFNDTVRRSLSVLTKKHPAQTLWADKNKESRENLAKARSILQRPVRGFQKSENFQAYLRMIEFLHGKGAETCLLYSPVSIKYKQVVESDSLYAEAIREFNQIAVLHDVNFVTADDLDISFTNDMFVNQDHLNAYGSSFFSNAAIEACFGKR